jgi:membrane protein implicated in regulation of membrane protease activity
MNRSPAGMGNLTMIVIAVVVAFLAIIFYIIFLAVFSAVVVYFLWRYHARIKELERRLDEATGKQGGSLPPSA